MLELIIQCVMLLIFVAFYFRVGCWCVSMMPTKEDYGPNPPKFNYVASFLFIAFLFLLWPLLPLIFAWQALDPKKKR